MTDEKIPERRPPKADENEARQVERKNAITVIIDLLNEQWNIDISDELLERLGLLAEQTSTTADENSALTYARAVFRRAEERGRAYSKPERMLFRIGSLFSDVGKSGPLNATSRQLELVARMYAVENVPFPEILTVTDFFKNHMRKPWFGDRFDHFIKRSWQWKLRRLFGTLGIGHADDVTMRQFYDIHPTWTLDLISEDGSGIPKEGIPAAACHHRLRGDNPRGIIGEDDVYLSDFGTNHSYSRAEKLVSALDLYDACRRRSEMTHDEAVLALKDAVTEGRDGFYANDPEFAEIIADIEAEPWKPKEESK